MYTEENQTATGKIAAGERVVDRAQFRADPSVIKASVLGKDLTVSECTLLANIMSVRSLSAGDRLVNEGDSDTRLFLLAAGSLAVIKGSAVEESQVSTMTQGECAGTRAFVDRTPRKASLQAIGRAIVYALKPEAIESLAETDPKVAYKFMRALFSVTHSNLLRVKHEREQLTNYISRSSGRY
jgi:CRP-like cAMP-binding protein